jgi:hypothetical protein
MCRAGVLQRIPDRVFRDDDPQAEIDGIKHSC